MSDASGMAASDRAVVIGVGGVVLHGDLGFPSETARPKGLVIFVHGSGSSRLSPRNRAVAAGLRSGGLATLLMDLLTEPEEAEDLLTRALRFDISLLAGRVVGAVDWAGAEPQTRGLPVGLFGASTGAAAALIAATERPEAVRAVVSRGGRPDLAGSALPRVRAPTLFIVGGNDRLVRQLNEQALAAMGAVGRLVEVPGATHLFEEHGALEAVTRLARDWFAANLDAAAS